MPYTLDMMPHTFSGSHSVWCAFRSSFRMTQSATTNDEVYLAKWIFRFGATFGHWPFNNKIISNNNRINRYTVIDWLRSSISVCLYLVCAYCQIQFISQAETFDFSISMEFCVALALVNVYFLSSVLSVVLAIWNRNNFFKIISVNREFDKEVSMKSIVNEQYIYALIIQKYSQMQLHGYEINHRPFIYACLCSIIAALILSTVIIIAFVILNTSVELSLLKKFYTFFIITSRYSQLTLLCLFSYCLLSIRRRFRLLNSALLNANDTPKAISQCHDGISGEIIDLLNRLALQHANLTDGVANISKCYSLQVSRPEIDSKIFGASVRKH